jgi:hypothetical protein
LLRQNNNGVLCWKRLTVEFLFPENIGCGWPAFFSAQSLTLDVCRVKRESVTYLFLASMLFSGLTGNQAKTFARAALGRDFSVQASIDSLPLLMGGSRRRS